MEAKRIVARFLEIFSTGNVDAILASLTEDATWWVLGNIDGMSGTHDKAGLGSLLAGVAGLYRDGALLITPTGMISEGSSVAVEARSHGVLKDGRVYSNQYHFLFELAGDRILRVREYSDTHHMIEIFGKPVPATGGQI